MKCPTCNGRGEILKVKIEQFDIGPLRATTYNPSSKQTKYIVCPECNGSGRV